MSDSTPILTTLSETCACAAPAPSAAAIASAIRLRFMLFMVLLLGDGATRRPARRGWQSV